MVLQFLVNGSSDCGPSNPLQSLANQFDRDRGIQQDQFRTRTSSTQLFKTQQASQPGFDQDAALFFAPQTPAPAPTAFDLFSLREALPLQTTTVQQPSWAADFLHSSSSQTVAAREFETAAPVLEAPQGGAQWSSPVFGQGMNPFQSFMPAMPMLAPTRIQPDHSLWDKEFQSQEDALTSSASRDMVHPQLPTSAPQDDLARTAGLVVDFVKHESNPKFQNSQFLGLMKQLRDGVVVVKDDQIVEASSVDGARAIMPSTASWFQTGRDDVKGKARAVDPVGAHTQEVADQNEAYFRKENEDFARYWTDYYSGTTAVPPPPLQTAAWDHLQEQWDRFEATSTGIRPIHNYQFQINNPYLHHRHASSFEGQGKTVHECVLELEAAVQRDPTDPKGWFELGVKQQENEREQKAVQALQRAIDLDPAHLPSWLALAVSRTNEGDRSGTFDAISEWVNRNSKYASVVERYRSEVESGDGRTAVKRDPLDRLIDCMIAMARSEGEIDADVQIALAILLNSNEDYEKARDCFRTALAVRPNDWLLYNRVGATIANSGRSEEALQYYYRALELNPAYIRARFNIGISCSNLRRYEEAAQHLLDALVLQDSDGIRNNTNDARGITSDTLWDALKLTCMHMQKVELATLCDLRDLDGFRDAFQG